MKNVCGLVLTLLLLSPASAEAQRLVLLVRHAERADGGAGAMTKATDPPLSAEGESRAAKLAAMLADAGVQAIFASEYRRTQDTVKPLAKKVGIAVTMVPAGDTPSLIARLKSSHANDVVLIAGHSNTLPEVIKALGGPAVSIADNEYGDLFVLVPANGAFSRIRY